MILRKFPVVMAAAVISAAQAMAAVDAETAFKSAPMSVFPLLDRSTRLDMVDYFNSGMETPSVNALDGKSRITALTPRNLDIRMTDASTYSLNILDLANGSAIAVVRTVATPAPDSKMTVYTDDWATVITDKVFTRPVLRDWLTDEGRRNIAEVESLVPFLMIDYQIDAENSRLRMTNNLKEFLAEEIYEMVSPYFVESLTYKWDGKKFVPEK